MSTKTPQLICEDNLSYAWGRAFLLALNTGQERLSPLIISIGGYLDGIPTEDHRIRTALDGALAEQRKCSCAESAFTIFPYKHWKRTGHLARTELYEWYLNKILPRLKARDRKNGYGTYFERLIASTGIRNLRSKPNMVTVNQLEHIIQDWHRDRDHPKRPRRSALQCACFDPPKDHTGQSVRGFPCLQQLSFDYDADGLAIHAFYPTQYIFDRAYGNYLGLSHLGHFMAHELNLPFVRLNCYIGQPELGQVTKMSLREMALDIQVLLPSSESGRSSVGESVIAIKGGA